MLFEGFQLSDDAVGILWVVFRNPGLNGGSVKQKHGRSGGINALADRLRQVSKAAEQGLQVIQEILLEPCEFGSVWNNAEAAEIAEFL